MKTIFSSIVIAVVIFSGCSSRTGTNTSKKELPMNNGSSSVYDFTMLSLEGDTVPLSNYEGKVLVVVNTASKCGLTPQYKDIEAFYKKYNDEGVEVLGFPANNFLFQEPGSDKEIAEFCERNYGVSFPMFSKISVKGKQIHPLYEYLTEKERNGVFDAPVQWNFQKFLVDKKGHVVRYFDPKTSVTEPEFIEAVEQLIRS